MPTPVRIAALMAVLALLVPSAALAQSGGDGGAGDSQYSDPFGTQTQAKPSKPAAPAKQQQQQPAAQQQQATPAPAASAAQSAPATQSQSTSQAGQQQTAPAQSLPRTGFDVVPVAAAGLLLLLGGLALWRRPHGGR
jgi:LPXTG-motif cell wall-anchored protein